MKFFHRLRTQFRKKKLDQELSEEVAFHIEQETQENIAAGMSAEEARYAALRKFGGIDQVKEECRDAWGVRFIDTLLQDVRFGLRMMAKKLGFTAAAVITLALGIGMNTAMFSVIDGVLLRPLPYPEPERIVQVAIVSKGQGNWTSFSAKQFDFWNAHSEPFQQLAAMTSVGFNLVGGIRPERVRALRVSTGYFPVLDR